jgi:hypothetical protein
MPLLYYVPTMPHDHDNNDDDSSESRIEQFTKNRRLVGNGAERLETGLTPEIENFRARQADALMRCLSSHRDMLLMADLNAPRSRSCPPCPVPTRVASPGLALPCVTPPPSPYPLPPPAQPSMCVPLGSGVRKVD